MMMAPVILNPMSTFSHFFVSELHTHCGIFVGRQTDVLRQLKLRITGPGNRIVGALLCWVLG